MAWNEPGGGGKDPWGRRREQGPPDLDQILKNVRDKLAGLFGGGGGGGGRGSENVNRIGLGLIVGVALVLWLLSGLYIVQQGERGVELKFGKKNEVTGPGLHWRWPYPVERVEKVNVEQVLPLEIGYRRNERAGTTAKVPKEALMLTQDENIIDIEFTIQYRVKDPSDFLFNVRDVENTIVQVTESAVREIVGKSTLDFIITEGRSDIQEKTRALLQEILDRYKSGIQIVTVQMQKASPPDEVKAAFDDAVKAREDEQRLKNEAEAYANDIIPRARGGAARLLQEAQGYRASVIARAEGDARRFTSVVSEYAKAPTVTRDRLYIETMEQVLSNTTKIFVDQKGGNNILYLPLDRLVPQLGAPSAGPVATLQPLPEPAETGGAQPAGRERVRDLRDRGLR